MSKEPLLPTGKRRSVQKSLIQPQAGKRAGAPGQLAGDAPKKDGLCAIHGL
jgi:hypothetical protein